MPETSEAPLAVAMPETTVLLLSTFADLYRQEVAAEEDVHRTLPFFGTALGVVIGALAYAAGRLPRWVDLSTQPSVAALTIAALLLTFAVAEAGCVVVFLSRAIARRDYQRLGPEGVLRCRFAELQATAGAGDAAADRVFADEIRQRLIGSYAVATLANRVLNQKRRNFRAFASSDLLRSLLWALGATTVVVVGDKLGCLPKVSQ